MDSIKKIKGCPICGDLMHIFTYPENVKSVWSGQDILVCETCGYSEDKYGNRVPRWDR